MLIVELPKRLAWFKIIQQENDKLSLRPFCSTRWTLRYTSLASILNNYEELQNFFLELSNAEKNEAGAKANRFMKQLDRADNGS